MTLKMRQILQVEVLDFLSLTTTSRSVTTVAQLKKNTVDVMMRRTAFTQLQW